MSSQALGPASVTICFLLKHYTQKTEDEASRLARSLRPFPPLGGGEAGSPQTHELTDGKNASNLSIAGHGHVGEASATEPLFFACD